MTFNNTTIPNNFYPVANAVASSNPFVVAFVNRDPTVFDVAYPIQKLWLNTMTNEFWFLKNFVTQGTGGIIEANWISLSGVALLETLTGDDGHAVPPVANNINLIGNVVANGTNAKPLYFHWTGVNPNEELDLQLTEAASTSVVNNAGIASFNSAQFSVDSNGYVSTTAMGNFAFNYTNVTHAMSPYTVVTSPANSADFYISVDCSGGAVTLKFPNAPNFKQLWIVKDRTGSASTNNITITTVGGAVTVDGQTSYIITSNYGAVNLLANATPSYEVW